MVLNKAIMQDPEALAGEPDAELIIALGRAYHQSGVPVDELEETMHAAAAAIGIELQVTALPTSITAALGPGYAQRVVLLRLEPGMVDLRRLALLNGVFARVVAKRVPSRVALAEVERIAALSHAGPPGATIAANVSLCVGAAIILGGHGREIEAAACIGLAIGVLDVVGRRIAAFDRLYEVFAGVAATLVVSVFFHFGPLEAYVPIVAGVVQFLPGLQITEALHELAHRNIVAGTARLGSVLITLLSLACGFALGIALAGPSAFHLHRIVYVPIPWYGLAFAVFAIASAIGVLQHARLADFPWVYGSCAVAELAYHFFATLPGYQVAAFGGALAVGVFANLVARFARVPQTVLLIPGLLILVPGALSYESILLILQRDVTDAGGIALSSSVAAIEIVSGLLLSQLFFAPVRFGKR